MMARGAAVVAALLRHVAADSLRRLSEQEYEEYKAPCNSCCEPNEWDGLIKGCQEDECSPLNHVNPVWVCPPGKIVGCHCASCTEKTFKFCPESNCSFAIPEAVETGGRAPIVFWIRDDNVPDAVIETDRYGEWIWLRQDQSTYTRIDGEEWRKTADLGPRAAKIRAQPCLNMLCTQDLYGQIPSPSAWAGQMLMEEALAAKDRISLIYDLR